jgi:hypothetical protein
VIFIWGAPQAALRGGEFFDIARRRQVGLSAALLARSQPDRAVFAKLKTLLRKTDPRTAEATWRGIGILLDRFKPAECANDLVNAGYASA